MERAEDVFQRTLEQLSSGLTAGLIAETQMQMFEVSQPADFVHEVMQNYDFSQAPVTRSGEIVGVVDRNLPRQGHTTEEWMIPLSARLMISSEASLRSVIRLLANDDIRFRLIVGASGIAGIVTRSDLAKLPVRLLQFSYVTHLESVLAEVIANRSSGDDWLQYLERWDKSLGPRASAAASHCAGSKAIDTLRISQNKLAREDIVPPLLEVTDFSHKWVIVCNMLDLGQKFANETADIQQHLRNAVAHARNAVATDLHLEQMDCLLAKCEQWIEALSEHE